MPNATKKHSIRVECYALGAYGVEPEVIRFSERLGASAQLSQGPGSVKYKVAPWLG